MGTIDVTRALADPQHVRRAVVPGVGERVLAGERLLVTEDERLVAGVDVDLAQVRVGLGVDVAGAHEPHRPVDLAGEALVPATLGARRHEVLVPRVHAGEVGEAALGERPQQVERGRRLVVGLHEAVGIGDARLGERAGVVDDVAAERRQDDAVHELGRARTGLGELAGDAADLHDGDPHRVRQDHRHLQDDAQLLADVVGGELLEALGAVTRLEQERVAGRDLGQTGLQRPGLAGEHQGRIARQRLQRAVETVEVGPLGLLARLAVLPRRWCPRHGHAAQSRDAGRTTGVAIPRRSGPPVQAGRSR